jgi:hypothetical protein
MAYLGLYRYRKINVGMERVCAGCRTYLEANIMTRRGDVFILDHNIDSESSEFIRQGSMITHSVSPLTVRDTRYLGIITNNIALCAEASSSHVPQLLPQAVSLLRPGGGASRARGKMWMGHGPERRLRASRGPCAGFGVEVAVLPCGTFECCWRN